MPADTEPRSWQSNPYMARVGKRIAAARSASGMTQQRLAELIGVTRSSVANMEGGRQSVDAVQLAQLARALRVGIESLVLADDLPPEPELPHDVTVERVWRLTCRTCDRAPRDFRDRRAAAEERDRHVAGTLAPDSGGEDANAR